MIQPKLFILAGFIVSAGLAAHAAPSATFNFSNELLVAKCTGVKNTDGTTTQNCEKAKDGSQRTNFHISFDKCLTAKDDGTDCTGTGNLAVTVDGVAFKSTVTVVRHMVRNMPATFEISTSIDNQDPMIDIKMSKAMITDTSILLSNPVISTTDKMITYTPILAIGPVTAALEDDLAERMSAIH